MALEARPSADDLVTIIAPDLSARDLKLVLKMAYLGDAKEPVDMETVELLNLDSEWNHLFQMGLDYGDGFPTDDDFGYFGRMEQGFKIEKRGRKRKKQTSDGESDEDYDPSEDLKEERKTGKRGRPRKRPLSDEKEDVTNNLDLDGQSTYLSKRTPRSQVWRFFERIGENGDIAVCQAKDCGSTFAVAGGSTSTITRHLRVAHEDLFKQMEDLKVQMDEEKKEAEQLFQQEYEKKAANPTEEPKAYRSAVWKYFAKIADGTMAICEICKSQFNTPKGVTSNLNRHLKVNHPEEFEQMEEDKRALEEMKNDAVPIETIRPAGKRSHVWNFFSRTTLPGSNQCNICEKKILAADHSTSNMITHLKINHQQAVSVLKWPTVSW